MLGTTMKKWLICLLFAWPIAVVSLCQELSVYTEEYKPFQYFNEQGQLSGFGIDLVTEMFNLADIEFKGKKIELYPWARAYHYLEINAGSALFMTVRNDSRENQFKWVGPLAPRELWLYKLTSRQDIQLKTLKDAKSYLIGGYYQSAGLEYMQELGFKVQVFRGQSLITKLLVKGRFDLMPSLHLTMVERLKDLGLNYNMVEKTVLMDGRYEYYLALNKSVPDDLVNQLQAALNTLKSSGRYQEIWQKYAQ